MPDNTNPFATVPTVDVGAAVTQAIQTKVLSSLPPAFANSINLYLPVLTRLANSNITALTNTLIGGTAAQATTLVRDNMTMKELADEKAVLTELTKQFAADSAATIEFQTAMVQNVLNTALSLAIAQL